MEGFVTVDTLYLHIKYPLRDIFDEYYRFVSMLDPRVLKEGCVVRNFVVKTGGSGYKISVWQHDARAYLTDRVDQICGDGQGMGIWIQLGPKFLLEHINNLQHGVNEFLSELGLKKEYPISITRIDIAIDCLGVSMKNQDVEFWKEGWVGRSKLSKVFYNSRTGLLESLYVGSRNSPIMLRVYDKVAQSIPDGDYEYWIDVWKEYDGAVTRIEWEVKTKDGNFSTDLTNFSDFNGFSVRELLNYLMRWGRLCVPDEDDGNRNRWKESPLWLELQDFVNKWADGVDWPTSRYGKAFHDVSPAYIKSLAGSLTGGMARLSEGDPSLMGLLDGLKKYGKGIETLSYEAKRKRSIIRRL